MGYDVDYRVRPLTISHVIQPFIINNAEVASGRDAFFRSGILFKESASRRRRHRANEVF